MSKPWRRKLNKTPKRADVERQLKHLEAMVGLALKCFKSGCVEKALGMDECLTCEKLGRSFRIISCAKHRADGLARVKKHALVKHPANLLRVVAAGLKGEEI